MHPNTNAKDSEAVMLHEFSLLFSVGGALNISVFGTWRAGLFAGLCGQ